MRRLVEHLRNIILPNAEFAANFSGDDGLGTDTMKRAFDSV